MAKVERSSVVEVRAFLSPNIQHSPEDCNSGETVSDTGLSEVNITYGAQSPVNQKHTTEVQLGEIQGGDECCDAVPGSDMTVEEYESFKVQTWTRRVSEMGKECGSLYQRAWTEPDRVADEVLFHAAVIVGVYTFGLSRIPAVAEARHAHQQQHISDLYAGK